MSVLLAPLGIKYGFRPELGGSIVQDIVPVRRFQDEEISIGSTVPLSPHVEMAFSSFARTTWPSCAFAKIMSGAPGLL